VENADVFGIALRDGMVLESLRRQRQFAQIEIDMSNVSKILRRGARRLRDCELQRRMIVILGSETDSSPK